MVRKTLIDNDNKLEERRKIIDRIKALEGTLTTCTKCGGELIFRGAGTYLCNKCGIFEYDDYGKLRKYIEKKGTDNPVDIVDVGVSLAKVTEFLREGRVEIAEGSSHYIHCVGCGVNLKYGKYCPECAAKLPKGAVTLGEIGEIPKNVSKVADTLDVKGSFD